MRLLRLFATLFAFVWTVNGTSNGLQDVVTWDPYSIVINDTRVFIFGGEFHYQRMPVPEMWLDIFHKFKANGLNAVSIYFFWSYHSAAKDVFDFETAGKNVQRVMDYAKEAGLYVIARAGPYCNAETNAGGLALWGSDGSLGQGKLRTSDATYYASWQPFIAKIGAIIAANQITKGGPVILNQVENELQETTYSATNTLVIYMEQLKTAYKAAGITVPLTHNEKGLRSMSWSTDYQNVGGAIDMYGLDSYPGGFSCTNINSGFNLVRTYNQWWNNVSYTQPNYLAEFEGGYFTPWGGSFYDDCKAEHDTAFPDVYFKNNIGQRTTLLSIYMTYGGTNWGHSAAPVVYSSYDYSAPLRETRQIQLKFYQTKLIALFTRVSADLLKADMVGNGTGYSVSSTAIWTWELRNPDTNAGFYVVQHATSNSRVSDTFSASLNTSKGVIVVPDINLNGRQSKILVTDYNFGKSSLLYSTADILTYGVFDQDVIAFYLQIGQIGQFALDNMPFASNYTVYGSATVTKSWANNTMTFVYTQTVGQTVLKVNSILIYLLEQQTAWKFWAPPTTINPTVQPDEQIFVLGPYLVRSAVASKTVVSVYGDNDNATTIEVYTGNPKIALIEWNGIHLETTATAYGSVIGKIPGSENRTISLPLLSTWRSANSLPEKDSTYDDSKWKVCNKTTTLSPVAPVTLPVLFSSDYGYYTGAKLYRGYFSGTNFTTLTITASGGLAFGWSAWLNGILIGGDNGTSLLTTTSANLTLPSSALQSKNIVTVVVDYHGHDQTSTAKGVENPRGILGASLSPLPSNSSTATGFTTWKIQGNAGGSANIDYIRGPMNEGGLYAERLGWHLPKFAPSSAFDRSTPFTGISKSGIQFYTTTFDLRIDTDLDVPLGIHLASPVGTVARIMIWVNGYQYGKYVPHIGPQTRFPIPPGVINNRGSNTLTLSLWAMTDAGAKLDNVELFSYGAYQTNFKFNFDADYLQPGYDASRLQYA